MSVVVLSFNAVFPLLAFMLLGFFLKGRGFMPGISPKEINKLVFKVFLPMNIFMSIYNADLRTLFDLKVALFTAASSILGYIVISFLVNRRVKDNTAAPVIIQGIHKANYNLLAIGIVSSFFGDNIGMTVVLIAVITPIVNTCSTIAFETANGGTVSTAKLIKKIITNPLVCSSLLGVFVNLCGLRFPDLLMTGIIKKLAGMATPLAMLSLGAQFDFAGLKKYSRELVWVSLGKLLIFPAVSVTFAMLMGIRDANLIAVFLCSGGPASVNSYSTAVSMGGNEELAGLIVVVTSLLSILSMFGWLCLMGFLGWI